MLRLLAQCAAHRQPAGAVIPLSALQPRCTGCALHQQASSPAASVTEQRHGEQRAPEAALAQQSAGTLRQTPVSSAETVDSTSTCALQESRSRALRHVAHSLEPSFSPLVGSQLSPLQRQGLPPPSPRSVAQPSLGRSFAGWSEKQARQLSAALSDGRWHHGASRLPLPAAMHGLQSSVISSRRPLSGLHRCGLHSRATPVLEDSACPSAGVRQLATVRVTISRDVVQHLYRNATGEPGIGKRPARLESFRSM